MHPHSSFSDMYELLYSPFTPHSLRDGASAYILCEIILGYCQVLTLSSFFLHLSIQTLVILHFGTFKPVRNIYIYIFLSGTCLTVSAQCPFFYFFLTRGNLHTWVNDHIIVSLAGSQLWSRLGLFRALFFCY